MNLFSPKETAENYMTFRMTRASFPRWKLFLLAFIGGLLIALGALVTNTASHAIDNPSLVRLINGLLFPFGLGILLLVGGELFTGNCMMSLPWLERKITLKKLLENWLIVFFGNALGAVWLASAAVYCGQVNYSKVAEYTIKVATYKATLSFFDAFTSGLLCNICVCLAVFCALTAKDTIGKIVGAYLPVAFFVIAGFEHSIANLYYLPAGLFAMNRFDLFSEGLTWTNFLIGNLLPVTLGNIVGGFTVGAILWLSYIKE